MERHQTIISTEAAVLRIVAASRSAADAPAFAELTRFWTALDLTIGTAWALGSPARLRRRTIEVFGNPFEVGLQGWTAHRDLGEILCTTGDSDLGAGVTAPRVLTLRMASPLELLVLLPPAFAASSGVISLFLHMVERVFTAKVRIQADRERYEAERAEWKLRRTKAELSLVALTTREIRRRRRGEQPQADWLDVIELDLDDAP